MSGRSEHTRRPSVRFESSPAPSSGSRHQRSDSGVGSLSDYDLHDAEADRAARRRPASTSITTLQLALEREREEKIRALEDLGIALKDAEKWKKKAHDADTLRVEIQRQLTETKALLASSQGLANRVELLEQETYDLRKENKKLVDSNSTLEERLKKACKKLEKLSGDDHTPPPSGLRGGGNGPADGSTEKLKRRMSKSHKGNEAEKEKEKLRSRFDRSDQSDTSGSNGGKVRRRRDSTCYVEPLGQSAPRPQVPMPPSPTRRFSSYTTTQQQPPQFTSMKPPVVGQVPRSVHPAVTYAYDDPTGYQDREDGNYNIHPLPREHRR